jgi:thioredoxin reductase/pSer/pThr/pTyr-binding forkhead associated (FHA) protein/NAD-dependent dihydropyrimidine dehydrogenase PreA subunit
MIILDFTEGPHQGERFEVAKSRVLIGTAPDCDLILPADGELGERHCVIESFEGEHRLIDLGTQNGTRIGGPGGQLMTRPVSLSAGDVLSFGRSTCTVSFDEHATVMFDVREVERQLHQRLKRKTMAPPPSSMTGVMLRVTVPLGAVRESLNATQPWEGVGPEGFFIVERQDTSNHPVEIPEEQERRAKLAFISGPHQERRVFLGTDPVSLGRAEDNDVVIADPLVALYHFQVSSERSGHMLTPLVDKNPPTINGHALKRPRFLADGDVIAAGASILEYVSTGGSVRGIPAGDTIVVKPARFAFRGDVLVQPQLTIGRDPGSDLFIDDDDVERTHASIRFDDVFKVKDHSHLGTYVGGKRVVDYRLKTGDVIHIAEWQLKCTIEDVVCTIDIGRPPSARTTESFGFDLESVSPYQTMYRVALGAQDEAVRPSGRDISGGGEAPKKKKEKRKWSPPSDVERTWRTPLAIVTAVLMTLVLVGVFARAGAAYLHRPTSAAHATPEYAERLKSRLSTTDGCAGCHRAFEGAQAASCSGCHDEHPLRPAHQGAVAPSELSSAAEAAPRDASRPTDCVACHTEHRAVLAPALLAGERCVSCHERRHEKLILSSPGPVKQAAKKRADSTLDIKADLALRWPERVQQLHEKHDALERRCAACHANQALSTRVASAWSACLRCHDAKDALASEQCGECHREHGRDWAAPAKEQPMLASSPKGTTALALLMLVFPLGLVISFHQITRRRREDADAERQAKEDEEKAKAQPAEGKLVHNINLEKCVGCSSCINSCPNDVLQLINHKSVVVRFDNCHQCRACEQICPSGALTMAPAGAPPRMIELPDLDSNYETNIPGIYLIGEAAGKSLVKNANNLGYRVVQHMMVKGVQPGAAESLGYDADVLIVGSGPGGLSAGITAHTHGLKHIIFEKDRLAFSTIQTYPRKKELLAEPPDVKNIGPLPVWDSYKEEILERWFLELKKYDLDIRCCEEVRALKTLGANGGFELTTSKGVYRALRIVLATGTRGNPRTLRIPGGELDKVGYVLIDPSSYVDNDVMIVGGGDSAIEAAVAIAGASNGSNRVCISYRQNDFGRAKDRNREALKKLVEARRITLHLETNPLEIRQDAVVLQRADQSVIEVKNQALYCMLGADPPVKWLKEIGIQYVKKPENWNPGPSDDLAFLEMLQKAS